MCICGNFWPNIGLYDPFGAIWNKVRQWFSDMWGPELLLPPNIIRMFGWLVCGCGARAVSRKTPIYFIEQLFNNGKLLFTCTLGIYENLKTFVHYQIFGVSLDDIT